MPRLEYILQSIILNNDECEKIQQPYIMIAKNKIGLARTIPNHIMSYSGILSMRMLWNALKTKQTLSLINRLNKNCEVKDITEIRIRQRQQITCCTNSIWAEKLDEMEIKLLKDNLASSIIQNNLSLGIEIMFNKEQWIVKTTGILIKNLMKKKIFIKAAKMLCDLDIVVLEQVLNVEGSHLMT